MIIKYLAAFCTFGYWQSRCHMLVIIACLSLACLGQMPDSSAGWVLPLPMPLAACEKKKPTKGKEIVAVVPENDIAKPNIPKLVKLLPRTMLEPLVWCQPYAA